MKKIRCIIVEDEVQNQKLLQALLEDYCEGVKVLALAANVQEGVEAIRQHQPDLVFLDIEMPRENGFQLYQYFDKITFEVIFTTAYAQYAIQAIKQAAIDYLVKPINLDELQEALERFREKKHKKVDKKKNHEVIQQIINGNNKQDQKIALACSDGYVFVNINNIIRCEANKSYTLFVIDGQNDILTSKNLASYEKLLQEYGFKRIHRSHMINPNFIQRFVRAKRPTVIMEDGKEISISANKKSDLLDDFLMP